MKLNKEKCIMGIKLIPIMLLAVVMLLSIPVVAQEGNGVEEKKEFRFADEELMAFFDINQEISVLQRETQQDIEGTIQSHGLTMERFNQIAQAAQIGALDGGLFSDEEITSFNEAAPQVTSIQREMQQNLQNIITEKGLTPETYQGILSDYRTDQDLQAHVRDLLRERARQRILEEREQERANQAEEKGKP